MSCHEREPQLDAYVDGELEAQEQLQLERHFDDCSACRDAVAKTRRLILDARRLPQIAPADDLFPAIRERIEQQQQAAAGSRVRWMRGVAALLVVALAGTAALWLRRGPDPQAAASDSVSGPAARAAVQLAAPAVDPAVLEYVEAAEALTAAIDARRDRLSPQTLEILDKNLAIIDGAIEELRTALEADPDGPADTEVLRAMHAQKLQLLLRFNEIIS